MRSNTNKQHTLNKSSIYALINKRLGFVLLMVIIVIAVSSYYLEQDRLFKNIHDIALKRSNQYVMQFGHLLKDQHAVDNGSVQKSIEKFAESDIVFSEGTIASVLVRDNRSKIAAIFHRNEHTKNTITQIFLLLIFKLHKHLVMLLPNVILILMHIITALPYIQFV